MHVRTRPTSSAEPLGDARTSSRRDAARDRPGPTTGAEPVDVRPSTTQSPSLKKSGSFHAQLPAWISGESPVPPAMPPDAADVRTANDSAADGAVPRDAQADSRRRNGDQAVPAKAGAANKGGKRRVVEPLPPWQSQATDAVDTADTADAIDTTEGALDMTRAFGLMLGAARLGRLEQVQRMLAHGVSVNRANEVGLTALHVAANHAKLAVVEYLVRGRRADCDALSRLAGCRRRHVHLSRVLRQLARGADPALRDTDCETALHKAAAYRGISDELAAVLHALAAAGVPLDERNIVGHSALQVRRYCSYRVQTQAPR